ncbi:N-acetylmuramidase domain-containing protein, partial [Paraburkholderia sp.]|uniref:N-acetylmuramidase domain-containing protein n=1 Tax=Paraburkholderia sp. TaxID=1926495 RepID=UPI003A523538
MILRDTKGGRRIAEAWQSTSWGMFQVSGSNSEMVGWPTVGAFVAAAMARGCRHNSSKVGTALDANVHISR